MVNLASATSGAVITLSTSNDPEHPASNIIDGDPTTFWISTGMFPQEIVVTFASLKSVSSVKLQTTSVQEVQLQKCVSSDPSEFVQVHSQTVPTGDTCAIQSVNIDLDGGNEEMQHLKIIISKASHFFASIHTLDVEGKAA